MLSDNTRSLRRIKDKRPAGYHPAGLRHLLIFGSVPGLQALSTAPDLRHLEQT